MHIRHRCAVCWERQDQHFAWLEHVTSAHGAVLAEFGYQSCRPEDRQGGQCPGIEHDRRLPNYGVPRAPKVVDRSQPIRARDGTTYTPIPLPLE